MDDVGHSGVSHAAHHEHSGERQCVLEETAARFGAPGTPEHGHSGCLHAATQVDRASQAEVQQKIGPVMEVLHHGVRDGVPVRIGDRPNLALAGPPDRGGGLSSLGILRM
ncbi:hypothetical protein [Actinomadura sp. CNU-125]|uniref:hypothetical protein n=1 Tax=Actinomadura sp. CNU-125 TaxID=1904961 RepID=UPI00117803B9|nr:hypothetical protein [Actinomadura sp. CNU-125]